MDTITIPQFAMTIIGTLSLIFQNEIDDFCRRHL